MTCDVLGSLRCDCGGPLDHALWATAAEGCGAVVYLRGHEGRVIGLSCKIGAYVLPPRFNGFPRTEAADFSEEIGSGGTRLKGALSMATVAAATPPAGFLLHDQPTERMTDHRRLFLQP
jgi:hypothetical protein